MQHPRPEVRANCSTTLGLVATKELGAKDIVQHGGVPLLVGLLQDAHMEVRDAAFKCLLEVGGTCS